ncbi:MAG TPA: hypothetical protein PK573_06815 [Spirochaetota bacterium]|nr:hypothetical protein [Spirochaetota bacterium]HRZ25596.1 hypothetical protein [Spirochaetota bacterium]HSA15318.1 hypothetical protein [Spirochaetota bacterium]
MIVDALLLLLLMSFSIHILILIFYLLSKTRALFIWFLATAFSNFIIGMILTVVAIRNPERIRTMNLEFISWVLSGFISLFMLSIKIYLATRIYRRRRDPSSYHYSYFGKKVYNVATVKNYEVAIFILSMPFFLICGAYFLAKLRAMYL